MDHFRMLALYARKHDEVLTSDTDKKFVDKQTDKDLMYYSKIKLL